MNVGQTGVLVLPSSGSTRIDASIDRVQVYGTGNCAMAIGAGARAIINNVVLSGGTTCGLDVEGGVGTAQANVDNSVMSNNGNGIQTGAGGTVVVSNSDIVFNTASIALLGGNGLVQSFGTNRINGNGGGTAPSAYGAPTSANGQQ